jgi:hypothetical protein
LLQPGGAPPRSLDHPGDRRIEGSNGAHEKEMLMDHAMPETAHEMRDGEDFVCPNCGCEIMLKHHGDPAKMPNMGPFTCCCGTEMAPEHGAA